MKRFINKIDDNLPEGDYFTQARPPYVAQFITPDIANSVLREGVSAAGDPLWADSGFDTVAEYAHWAPRLCGIACLKMCLEAYNRSLDESLAVVARNTLNIGGYISKNDVGWRYSSLVKVAKNCYGLKKRINF